MIQVTKPVPDADLHEATAIMSGFDRPWFVAGGWAIDLYLERVTRPHKDVDIAILRQDQLHLQHHLAGWRLYIADTGELHPWREGEYIEMPLYCIWAYRPGRPQPHARPTLAASDQPDVEFFLSESTNTHWRFRRDLSITRSLSLACMRSSTGISYLAPEVVLLSKSKNPRDQDETDFEQVHGALNEEQKSWLKESIEKNDPDHPWLVKL